MGLKGLANSISQADLDALIHANLNLLDADDHAQYLLLTGRSGQTILDTIKIKIDSATAFVLETVAGATVLTFDTVNKVFTFGDGSVGDSILKFMVQSVTVWQWKMDDSDGDKIKLLGPNNEEYLTGDTDVIIINKEFETEGGVTQKDKIITSADSPYDVAINDHNIIVDLSGGAVTVKLPILTNGRDIITRPYNHVSNKLTIEVQSGDDLFGVTNGTQAYNAGEAQRFHGNTIAGWL